MADNDNPVRKGDVDNPGHDINLKDLLHLTDVVDGRTQELVEHKESLYDVDDDNSVTQNDADTLQAILRGEIDPSELIYKLEFVWTYNEETDDAYLQVRNILRPNWVTGDEELVTEFCNVYFGTDTIPSGDFIENAEVDKNRIGITPDYAFEKSFEISYGVNAELVKSSDKFYLYINGFACYLTPSTISQDLIDTGSTPNTFDYDGLYPVSRKTTTEFISKWEIKEDNTEIVLPLGDLSSPHINRFRVDFGDGSPINVTSTTNTNVSHTYETAGFVQIKISGILKTWSFNNSIASDNIIEVSKWGCMDFTNTTHQFYGCNNLEITATDSPKIDANTSLEKCFMDCSKITGGVKNWNVKNVVSFKETFKNCTLFNEDISSWETSSAITMESMFANATRFNVDLNTVTNSSYSSWDVSNVTDMKSMFANATSFDQRLDTWNITSITNGNLANMFNNVKLSICNYGYTLRKWNLLEFQENLNLNFSAGNSNYDASTQKVKVSLETKIGSISDGGPPEDETEVCEAETVIVTLLNPTVEHINSKRDLMDSRQWQFVRSDQDVADSPILSSSGMLVPIYDYQFELLETLHSYENESLVDVIGENEHGMLVFNVVISDDDANHFHAYNYENKWTIKPGSVRIVTTHNTTPFEQQLEELEIPTNAIEAFDILSITDAIKGITSGIQTIYIPLNGLYVATIEYYYMIDKWSQYFSLPIELPTPGEFFYEFTRQDENLILENKIRVDHFGEQYVDANTIPDLPTNFPNKKDGMYIDNGATGVLVYIVARDEMEDRFFYPRETSVEIMFKEDGKWQGAQKFLDVVGRPPVSGVTEFFKEPYKDINYFEYENMLVLSGKYGCFKYKYDETKNNFTFYNKTSGSMHDERVIGITKDHDLITVGGGFEHGIIIYVWYNGETARRALYYSRQNDGPEYCDASEFPYYNHEKEIIEIVQFNGLSRLHSFKGEWVVTKRKYTIDIPNSKLDLVSEITTKKTVVNEVGESYYPHMFYDLNQAADYDDIFCPYPVASSDGVHTVIGIFELYWYPSADRIPMLYQNEDTDVYHFFDLNCDALINFKVFNNVLITIEYDRPESRENPGREYSGQEMWEHNANHIFVRFTEITESDGVVQLVQIGDRFNVNDVGSQQLLDNMSTRESPMLPDRISNGGAGGVGDWFRIITNSNNDRFSVLFT